MKKIPLLLLLIVFSIGCSDDDKKSDNEDLFTDESNTYKAILLYKNCSNEGNSKSGGVRYCVTDEVFNMHISAPDPCSIVTIIDVDGNVRTGYWGKKIDEGPCKRKP